jgi:hypothetical protein
MGAVAPHLVVAPHHDFGALHVNRSVGSWQRVLLITPVPLERAEVWSIGIV